MRAEISKALVLVIFASLLLLPATSQAGFNQVIDATFDFFVKSTTPASPPEDERGEAIHISTQSDFNQGTFNGTSADRDDNSGTLGIGYLNGSGVDQPSDEGLNNESLVGYWRLDRNVAGDGGTVQDYSGVENDGTTIGGIQTNMQGIFGTKAFTFDGCGCGDQYVDVGDLPVEGGGQMTISGWVNPDSKMTDSNQALLGARDNWDNYYVLGFDASDDYWFQLDDQNNNVAVRKAGIATDEWVFMAATFNQGTGRLFINGEEVGSDTNTNTDIPDVSNTANIGRLEGGGTADGKIDEVRLYNRSLTDSEINQLYFHGASGKFQGEYDRSVSIPSGHNVSKIQVDSQSIDSSVNETWITVEHSEGESETVELEPGNRNRNYSLDFSGTGGTVDITVNMTQSGSHPTSTPVVEDFALWTMASADNGSSGGVEWNRWG